MSALQDGEPDRNLVPGAEQRAEAQAAWDERLTAALIALMCRALLPHVIFPKAAWRVSAQIKWPRDVITASHRLRGRDLERATNDLGGSNQNENLLQIRCRLSKLR
jgi:hypothetical protein